MTTVHARDIWISFGEEDNGKLGRNGEKILHSNIIGSENFSAFFWGLFTPKKWREMIHFEQVTPDTEKETLLASFRNSFNCSILKKIREISEKTGFCSSCIFRLHKINQQTSSWVMAWDVWTIPNWKTQNEASPCEPSEVLYISNLQRGYQCHPIFWVRSK